MDDLGTISWEEFVEEAENFIRVSDEISDHWQLHGNKELPGQAYLVRQVKIFIPCDYPVDDPATIKDENWCEKLNPTLPEDPFEARCKAERPLISEHHILWSISYGVPVIYFNSWKSEFPGINPVTVEVAQKLVPHGNLVYSELSQAIHPILGTPFLHLHPCMSQELLRNTNKSNNKLVSWLSTVAPAALNLRIRPEYYKLTLGYPESKDDDKDSRSSDLDDGHLKKFNGDLNASSVT